MEELFKEAKIGKVKAVKIVRKSENQLSRGYGFVEVDSKLARQLLERLQKEGDNGRESGITKEIGGE